MTLLLIVVIVDIIARNQPNGISPQTTAFRYNRRYSILRRGTRIRPMILRVNRPRWRYKLICSRWLSQQICFRIKIYTHWVIKFNPWKLVVMDFCNRKRINKWFIGIISEININNTNRHWDNFLNYAKRYTGLI